MFYSDSGGWCSIQTAVMIFHSGSFMMFHSSGVHDLSFRQLSWCHEVHGISYGLLSCFIQPVFMMFLAGGFHDVSFRWGGFYDVLLKSDFMIFHSDGFHDISWWFIQLAFMRFQEAYMMFHSGVFHVSFRQLSCCFNQHSSMWLSLCFFQPVIMMFQWDCFPDVSFRWR